MSLALKTEDEVLLFDSIKKLLAKLAEAWDPEQGEIAAVPNQDLKEASRLSVELEKYEVI